VRVGAGRRLLRLAAFQERRQRIGQHQGPALHRKKPRGDEREGQLRPEQIPEQPQPRGAGHGQGAGLGERQAEKLGEVGEQGHDHLDDGVVAVEPAAEVEHQRVREAEKYGVQAEARARAGITEQSSQQRGV